MQTNNLYPVFLKLNQIETLIVGGGNVALEKLEALLFNDPEAKVTLVALDFKEEIIQLWDAKWNINLAHKAYDENDLADKRLVIAATDDPQLHVEIRKHAKARNMLINVADTPHLCDFYLGSTVKKGNLKIGISTNGKSPTFAKRFKELLNDTLPDDVDDLLIHLNKVRDRLKGDFDYKVKELNKLTQSLVK